MTHKEARAVYDRYGVNRENISSRNLRIYARRKKARFELYHGGCRFVDIAGIEHILFGARNDGSRIKHCLFPKKARPR
jgi:hypothetical protein